jgi:hypothetical protein
LRVEKRPVTENQGGDGLAFFAVVSGCGRILGGERLSLSSDRENALSLDRALPFLRTLPPFSTIFLSNCPSSPGAVFATIFYEFLNIGRLPWIAARSSAQD